MGKKFGITVMGETIWSEYGNFKS